MAESCDRIVANLRASGVTIDLLHFARHLHAPRIETRQGGRHIAFPLGDDPEHGLNGVWNLLEADPLSAEYTHVVAFGGVMPLLAGPLFAAWLGAALVTLFRGNDFDTGIFSSRRSDIVRFAIECSACVCAVSREKERRIAALYPDVRTVWIPNGIDGAEWEALPSDRARADAWRAEHVEPGRRVLGMIGQIKLKKGGPFLIDALLTSGHADRFHLLFVGDVDAATSTMLATHRDALHVTHHPFADRYELVARYLACDIVVIPSFYDGLPNVLLESAALAVPFIASTAGGMGDLLQDGRHGYLFHPGDSHGFRAAIARAASASREELRAMGEACAALVHTEYTATRETAAYHDLLASIHPPASGAPASDAPASGAPASGAAASGALASGAPASGVPASGAAAGSDVRKPSLIPIGDE